jgi:hypothetical protein
MQLVIDVAYIWIFFSESRDSLVRRCIDGSTDPEIQKLCDNSFDTGRLTFLISMVVGLSIQLCGFSFFSLSGICENGS